MRPIATDGVAWSAVCLAKPNELTEMPFGGRLVGANLPRNHVLNGGQDPQQEGAILGIIRPIEKHWECQNCLNTCFQLIKLFINFK